MSTKYHQNLRRTNLRQRAEVPKLFMNAISDDNIIDAEEDVQSQTAGQQFHEVLRQSPRSQFTPPPHNTVPAKPWNNNKFGWTNTPGAEKPDAQSGQQLPHFIHVEEDVLGDGLKGAFFLSRRMIIVIVFMFSLMIIGAQSVPDILELVFSFI